MESSEFSEWHFGHSVATVDPFYQLGLKNIKEEERESTENRPLPFSDRCHRI